MNDRLVARMAEKLNLRLSEENPTHGMSGSGVHFAYTRNGAKCVLKVTPRTGGDSGARSTGERELDFYCNLARYVSVRTPTLLGYHLDDDGVGMVLSVHGRIKAAPSWGRESWMSLATDLARIHAVAVPDRSRWQDAASPFYAIRNPDLPTVEGFWRKDLSDLLDSILASRTHIEEQISAAGQMFVHGDCHTENILVEDHALTWIDWQSAQIGSSARDLAFIDARATPSGARVPDEVLARYCDEFGADHAVMKRAVIAAELAIFIFEWPPYASFNTRLGTQRVRERTIELAMLWSQDS